MLRTAPNLETERLILRAHGSEDFGDVARMWADHKVVRYIGGRPSTREESWARLLRYAGSWAVLGFGFWTFRDKVDGTYLGEGGLLQGQRALDPSFGLTPEVGWALTPAVHGQGYAREALGAVLAWSDGAGIDRTVCLIEPGNTASIKLAHKLDYSKYHQTTYHGAQVNLYERSAKGLIMRA